MTPTEIITAIGKLGGRLYLDTGELRLKAPKGALSDELRSELKEQKQALTEFLTTAQSTSKNSATAITRANRDQPLPASFAQQRLWFLDELEPGSSTYNMSWSLRLQGQLNIPALQTALDTLVLRHESLRTRFTSDDVMPLQVIDSDQRITIDFSTHRDADDNWTKAWVNEQSSAPFCLQTGPLLRVHILETAADDHRLVIVIHHIISDAWSMSILFQELAYLYGCCCKTETSALDNLKIQYADFSAWQREWLQGAELDRQLSYWRTNLADAPPLLELPTDRARPVRQTYAGKHVKRRASAELMQQLQMLIQPLGISMFMLMQTAFSVLLARYSGTVDIVMGTPIAGRRHEELEPLIGFFLNTLVLRNNLSGNPAFIDLLKQTRSTTLTAYEHQDVPFEKLVEDLRPERELSHSPIFQVLFNLRAVSDESISLHELEVEFDVIERNTAKLDLSLSVDESPQGLSINFEYNTDLFDTCTIEGMADAYLALLDAIAANPQQAIGELPLLSDAELEQQRLAEHSLRPASPFTKFVADALNHSIVERFETQVSAHGEQTAAHSPNLSWTYRELNAQANKVAHALIASGATAGDRAGILLSQDVAMLAGLLGTLKAGLAYVPLDPEAPTARHQQIAAEAGLKIIVTDSNHLALAKQSVGPDMAVINVDPDGTGNTTNPDVNISPDSLAYILFTSGSTGTPKGVMQSHQNVLHHCRTYSNAAHLGASDRLTLLPPYGFDAAVMDIFGALLNGACLYPIDLRNETDPLGVANRVAAEGITVFHSTPTVFRFLLERDIDIDLTSVRLVVLGGEEARSSDFELFCKLFTDNAVFINGLGPSESTLALQYFARRDSRLPGLMVPVGRAVNDTAVVLLDDAGNPSGICGELAIRSRYVTPGYWNAPELSAAALQATDEPDVRLYRTGDHARYLADGQLIFTGRKDAQIKLRGHRIEVGEIEAVLTGNASVDNCVVVLRSDRAGTPQLVAYLTSTDNAPTDTAELRNFIRTRLPAYMVPAGIVCLDALPMTASGKIDRARLPEPAWEAGPDEFVAPRTPAEQALAEIWADILNLKQVGVHDDFFALGGHSLLATQIFARIRDSLQVELPLRAIFSTPTIEGLATQILKANDSPSNEKIPTGQRPEPPPQSFAQQRLWFLDQLEPGNAVYNLSVAVRLQGDLNAEALQLAVDDFVARHETLRTSFANTDDGPVQIIQSELHVPVEPIELADPDDETLALELSRLARQPFDLTAGPLLRIQLLSIAKDHHILVVMIHHIISDAWSMTVLWQELTRLYNAHCSGHSAGLADLPLQYADYASWQHNWLRGAELERQVEFWKTQLADAPALLELPTDKPRPAVQTYNGDQVMWSLEGEVSAALREIGKKSGCTLFMLLLAAYDVLLARYSDHEDVVVGSPIAGRRHTELEGLIGFFVNTLVMRTDLSGDPTYLELLERVKASTLAAYDHQDLPFEKLVEELQPGRDMSHTPIFQAVFILQNAPGRPAAFDQLEATGVSVGHGHSKFDLTLATWETANGLGGLFEFNTDLFERRTIETLASHFSALLTGLVANPQQAVSRIPLIDSAERHRLLVELNDTTSIYPRDATIQQAFESQVNKTPEHVALVCNEDTLTYAELNQRANQLAHYLREHNVGPDTPVGIYLDREINTVVAILAILKAGGAYLPLDPSYPAERLQFMLEDSDAPVVISLSSMLLNTDGRIRIDLDKLDLSGQPVDNPPCSANGTNLAYIIFTSGSTGQPKGTLIENHSVLRLVINTNYVQFSDSCRIAMLAPISFDASTFELWGSLLHGGRCVIFPKRIPTIDELGQFLQANRIDFLWLTATLFNTVIDTAPEILSTVKQLLTGGEALSVTHIARASELLPDTQLINGYGPTESTTFTTTYKIPRPLPIGLRNIPIGKPISNTNVYILDQHMEPVPVGLPGELYIGGDGLSRGYLNRAELTAERFVANPFSASNASRLYKTGDVVRYLNDGNIEFIGRSDDQIKLRGFRIELGEIEAALLEHANVNNAAVILHDHKTSGKRLVAYLVADKESSDLAQEMQRHLTDKIPKYMAPSIYIPVERIPQTSNGKLDRKALPNPEAYQQAMPAAGELPDSDAERALATIWGELLGTDNIGLDDDFFDLGGHSLLTIKLLQKIEAATGEQLTIADVFDNPTIRELSPMLANVHWQQTVEVKKNLWSRLRAKLG